MQFHIVVEIIVESRDNSLWAFHLTLCRLHTVVTDSLRLDFRWLKQIGLLHKVQEVTDEVTRTLARIQGQR